ncbi:MAG: T9SS type A sorting domain-containing protein [Bacteroidota bacterium]
MKKILHIIFLFFTYALTGNLVFAQVAKVYRGGTLIGTYTTLANASTAANAIGDSILLSAHTFKEFDIPMQGGQTWQGTMTATDTTTIDAESKGRIGVRLISGKGRALILRDIICAKGETIGSFGGELDGGAFYSTDSLILKGYTIIRNCHAKRSGGGVFHAYAQDHVKITNNYSDSCGGGGGHIFAMDSVEISFNTAKYGGAAGDATSTGGHLYTYSRGVLVCNNIASIAGGAVYGTIGIIEGQVIGNQAPLGAALYSTSGAEISALYNAKIYNPDASGKRQNEICLTKASLILGGVWFGKSDTIGLTKILKLPPFPDATITGKYAKANWSVNWGKPITNKDTLFPIGAAFTYNDGTSLPVKALPWLVGSFSSSTGKMLTPSPKMSPTDTLSSLFRTYVYTTKGDTTSKPINFTCIVDGDTFRTSPRVWGIDSIKLSISNSAKETQVMVYPNPAKEVLNIQGVEIGSSIELYDVMGKLVLQQVCDSTIIKLNVAHLTKGVYTLKITTKEGNEGSAKVMKE